MWTMWTLLGVHFVHIDAGRKAEGAIELSFRPPILSFFLGGRFTAGANLQLIVANLDIEIIGLKARGLGVNDDSIVLVVDVHSPR